MGGWNKDIGLKLNPEETIHPLEFATSQEAWEKLNEAFLRLDPVLFEKGGVANSGVAASYNVFIKVRKAWVDPNFDFGRSLMCPIDATTLVLPPKNFLIVFAFAGDSTITNLSVINIFLSYSKLLSYETYNLFCKSFFFSCISMVCTIYIAYI